MSLAGGPYGTVFSIKRASIKIERRDRVTDVYPGQEKRPEPVEHQPLDITRRDAHPFLCLWVITGQAHAVPSRIRLTRRRGLDTVFDKTIELSSPM
jgi:hypothetical protein